MSTEVKPTAEKFMPFIAASMKELAAGMEEKVAMLQESGYKDEVVAKEVLTIAAAFVGVSTLVSTLLGMTPSDFSSLTKQVVLQVLQEYDTILKGNVGNQVKDTDTRHHSH
jgi:hypothetical protein